MVKARSTSVRKPATGTTRQKLIDAAHSLIWANSYAHVSVEDICRAAGVQKGSFYHFFKAKSDLAAAALEDHWQFVRPKIDAIFVENKTAPAQLRALCREIRAKQEESLKTTGMVCGCPYATVSSEMCGEDSALSDMSRVMSERFYTYYKKILMNAAAQGLIPKAGIAARAREMQVYVLGAMMHARIMNQLDSVGVDLETALVRISGMPVAPVKARKAATKR